MPEKKSLGFEKNLEDQFVPINKATVLEIKTIGSPTQVKWYKNGEEINSNNDKVIIENLGSDQFQLTIPESLLSDSGNYSVKISNNDESAESSSKIIVDPVLSFLRPIKDVEVIEGINFNCQNN